MIQRNTNMRTWIQYHTKSPWTIISKYTFLRSLQNSKKILCNTMLFFQRRIRSNMKIKCRQMTSKHNYTNKHNKYIHNTQRERKYHCIHNNIIYTKNNFTTTYTMAYRLIKSEPYKYSREQFQKDGKTIRDGVRNFQARNNLKAMKKWDLCFRYHSNEGKEIVGIAQVSKEHFLDPTSDDSNRVVVEVIPYKTLYKPVSLEHIKQDPKLQNMTLLKQQRLSVAPVTADEYKHILSLWQQ